MTTRPPWMAFENAFNPKPAPAQGAMFLDGLGRILRACRSKTACCPTRPHQNAKRRNHNLINANNKNKKKSHDSDFTRFRALHFKKCLQKLPTFLFQNPRGNFHTMIQTRYSVDGCRSTQTTHLRIRQRINHASKS